MARAIDTYPAQTAEQFATRWPPVVSDPDTVTVTDTLVDIISVQCPDSIQYNTDSIPVKVPVYIKVPVQRVRETRTITIHTRDSVTVFICEAKAATLQRQVDSLQAQVKRRGKLAMWLGVVVAVLLIINIIQFKK